MNANGDKAISNLITSSGLSLGEISDVSGIGKSTLSAIKNGTYKVKEYQYTAIKDAIFKLKERKVIAEIQNEIDEDEAMLVTLVSTFKSLPSDRKNKLMECLFMFKNLN